MAEAGCKKHVVRTERMQAMLPFKLTTSANQKRA